MQATAEPQSKSRPFPWRCFRCRQREVVRATIPYTAEVNHDGIVHTIAIPALEVPRCQACGELVFDNIADEQINAALRTHLHLLTPDDIQSGRQRLKLTRCALADQIGVPEQSIADWEEGLVIQSRAMNNLLRVFFKSPEARAVLMEPPRDSTAGLLVG